MSSSSDESRDHYHQGRKRRREKDGDEELLERVKKMLENRVGRRSRRRRRRSPSSTSGSSSSSKKNRKNHRHSRSRSYSSDQYSIRGGERYPRGTSRHESRKDDERYPRGASRQGANNPGEENLRGILPPEEPGTQNEVFLSLLGEDVEQNQTGSPINEKLADKWSRVMKNGLTKETRQELTTKYPAAQNCLMMKAPTLNPEVKPAMNPASIKKDQYQSAAQNQLGCGIGAVGKALSLLLDATTVSIKDMSQLVETLSDAGRILSDLHHSLSITRRAFIVPGLSLLVKNIADETPVDTLLFGEELPNKLKAAKEVERSSKDIAKPQPTASVTKRPAAAGAKNSGGPQRQNYRKDLNSRGPPKKEYWSQSQGGHKSRQSRSDTKYRPRK